MADAQVNGSQQRNFHRYLEVETYKDGTWYGTCGDVEDLGGKSPEVVKEIQEAMNKLAALMEKNKQTLEEMGEG